MPPTADTNVVYYNASLFNPASGQPVPASVSDTRSQPIVDRPCDWECSIVRFDLSANLLPPIVVPMPGPPSGPGTVPTSMNVTLRSLGVDYQTVVNVFSPSPSTYGFVFSIDELLTRFNTALAASFAAMVPVAGVTTPPVFGFDPVTQLISMYAQDSYTTAPVEVYLNSAAYNFVVSMPAAFQGYNLPTGRDFRIQLETISAVTLPPVGAARAGLPVAVQAIPSPARSLAQAGVSLGSMNGVRTIILTTSMPINSESLPTTTGVAQNVNFSSNSLPIMTDFLLATSPRDNPAVDRLTVSYLPTAEYRMVQMRGNEPLMRLDLKWQFTLFDGSIRDMYIPPGGYCSAKVMFRRAAAQDLRA